MTGSYARVCLLLPVFAAGALVGCENTPSESEAASSLEVPQVVLTTPEDTARTVLGLLLADLRAAARRDDESAEARLEELRTVASAKAVEEVFALFSRYKVLVGDDLVKGCVNNWAATISYYAEGLHLDQMRRGSETPLKVAMIVPASGPEDEALIQVTCVLDDDALWRVSRVEFVTESAGGPVPSPASLPAQQP